MNRRPLPLPALSVTSTRAGIRAAVQSTTYTRAARGAQAVASGDADRPGLLALVRGDVGIFIVALAAYLALAVLVVEIWERQPGDSLTRTFDAVSVLSSRDPHLGAIGFVWPPLPTLLRLALLPILTPIGLTLYAGPVVSVIFGAGTLVVMRRVLAHWGLSSGWQVAWLLAWSLNPLIWLYSANGMTQVMGIFFVLLALYQVLRWEREGSHSTLIVAGVSLAFAFLARYETVAFAAVLALLVHFRSAPREGSPFIVASLVTLTAPLLWAVALWTWLNYQIQGDPFFYLNSAYSTANALDVARIVGPINDFFAAQGSVFGTITQASLKMLQAAAPFLIAVPFLVWRVVARHDRMALALLALSLSVPVAQAAQIYTGTLPPYLRNWNHATPLGLVVLAYLVWTARSHARQQWLSAAGLGAVVIGSAATIAFSMADNGLYTDGQPSNGLFSKSAVSWRDDNAPVAGLINDVLQPDDLLLVDATQTILLLFDVEHRDRVVINTDRDYDDLVHRPYSSGVTYILVGASKINEPDRNLIYRIYPDLYEGSEGFVELVADFPESGSQYRLFRVIGPSDADDVPSDGRSEVAGALASELDRAGGV